MLGTPISVADRKAISKMRLTGLGMIGNGLQVQQMAKDITAARLKREENKRIRDGTQKQWQIEQLEQQIEKANNEARQLKKVVRAKKVELDKLNAIP